MGNRHVRRRVGGHLPVGRDVPAVMKQQLMCKWAWSITGGKDGSVGCYLQVRECRNVAVQGSSCELGMSTGGSRDDGTCM